MLKNNYKSISKKYLASEKSNLTKEEVEAYFVARMPATYAAVSQALKEVSQKISYNVVSVLDLGAGLGAGTLAMKEVFPHIERATLIERNEEMISKGRKIIDKEWVRSDLKSALFSTHDLVLFSYSYGELPEKSRRGVLKKGWDAGEILVIVEPGTPRGFEGIMKAREWLLEWGGSLIAPCPHQRKCPMKGSRWCHFSVRLERTKEHKRTKGAMLGWEDEKFCYIAFSKTPISLSGSRLIGHPQKRTGQVALQLCTEDGLENKVISKRDKALYKKACKAKWGTSIEIDS